MNTGLGSWSPLNPQQTCEVPCGKLKSAAVKLRHAEGLQVDQCYMM